MRSKITHITTDLGFKNCCALFFVFFITINVSAQNTDKLIRKGNKAYGESKFSEAENHYSKVLEINPSQEKSLYNQGNAYYKQEKYEDAVQNFELSAQMLKDPLEQAAAYHNLGNTHFKAQKYQESLNAYKEALKRNPKDLETKYNLMLAKKMLEQQQNQNQQQNQDQDQNKEQEDNKNEEQNKNNKENQNNEEQQNQDQDQDQDQQKDNKKQEEQSQNGEQQQNKKGEEEKQSQQAITPSKLSKEEAERILEALMNEENKVQEKLIKKKGKPVKVENDKDW